VGVRERWKEEKRRAEKENGGGRFSTKMLRQRIVLAWWGRIIFSRNVARTTGYPVVK
jgi:hypothetical protein